MAREQQMFWFRQSKTNLFMQELFSYPVAFFHLSFTASPHIASVQKKLLYTFVYTV